MVAMTSRDEENFVEHWDHCASSIKNVEQTEAFKKKEDRSYRGRRRKTEDVEEEDGRQKI